MGDEVIGWLVLVSVVLSLLKAVELWGRSLLLSRGPVV